MYDKYLNSIIKILITALPMAILGAGSALAEGDVGVLVFYRLGASGEAAVEREIVALNGSDPCAVRQQGKVSGARGSMNLPEVERFLLLGCDRPLLGESVGGQAIERLGQKVENLIVVEGALTVFDDAPDSASSGRAYTLKLSRYNDSDPRSRADDLAALNRDASARPNAFHNEVVITAARASGIATPDDVTLLYYDSPSDGAAFRAANGDLMKRIGQFNKEHLVDYAYVSLSITH